MTIPRGVLAGLVVGLLALAISCNNNPPSGPSGGGTTGGAPPPAPGPATTGITLDGPRTVAPNATTQLTLTAQLSDGTTKDVTRDAVWTSGNTSRVTIAAAGLATGRILGESNITGRYAPPGQPVMARTRELIVVPDGTFRIVGRVTEDRIGIGVPSAQLTVKTGIGAGLTATASFDGRFRFYGVAGDVGIEARKAGYRDDFRQAFITDHDQPIDLVLNPGTPIEAVEGSYTLTVAASASCRGALPEGLRVRTYTAELTRDNRQLTVRLGGAAFLAGSGIFGGRIEPLGVVNFDFWDGYYGFYNYAASVAERIDTNQLLLVGAIAAQLSGDRISGSLAGRLDFQTSTRTRVAVCEAPDHSFELRRR